MPIYLLFASAFFPKHQSLILFSLYLFGVLVAILTAYLFKDTLFKGEDSPFIMEIPEYKAPSPKNIWLNVWDKTRDFVERAGTVILMATVVVWFLQSFSFDFNLVRDNSEVFWQRSEIIFLRCLICVDLAIGAQAFRCLRALWRRNRLSVPCRSFTGAEI